MSTLIYSPGVKVLIDTEEHGIVDISDDIRDGSVTLGENQLASLRVNLINHRRKYDGIFTPNDRVHVQLKRIRWLPIMSGYLNEVPYFSIYPRTVPLGASCTLKRVKFRFWDPGAQASAELLRNASPLGTEHEQQDGGLRDKVMALLTEVADWPLQNIHIGRIPDEWADKTEALREAVSEQISLYPSDLGMSGVASGTNASSSGHRFEEIDGPGTGQLPTFRTKVMPWEDVNRELDLTAPEVGGPGSVGSSSGFDDEWYLAMRWPYYESIPDLGTPSKEHLSQADTIHAKNWWKNRRILISNPKNNKAVVLRAADWGPPEVLERGIGMSRRAMRTVGAENGDYLEVRFANEKSPLGPLMHSSTTDPDASGSSAGEVYETAPDIVEGASGLRFTDADNLEGNTFAARQFIQGNWDVPKGIGGYADRNISGTNTPSDHSLGLALDIMVSSGEPNEAEIALGNAVAYWFIANPNVFGVDYVIWRDRINSGTGWRNYREDKWGANGQHPSVTQGHRDHVHISFLDTEQTDAGEMGGAWPGTNDPRLADATPGAGIIPEGSGFGGTFGGSGPLLNAALWVPTADPFSQALAGPRRLLNDVPLLPTVSRLTNASMRSYMAAPNGDFIAWFPDYFGIYGTAGKMKIRDIELANEGFSVAWSDEHLVTHQFTAGSFTGYNVGAVAPGGAITVENQLQTEGIATVEFPELMEALFNIDSTTENERAKLFRDADSILQRFGARVSYDPLNVISGPEAEFWYAVFLFQRSWAQQFSSQVSLTFMPEVYPGMLLQLEGFGLQVYVNSVTHSFSFQGGGFSTSANVSAPSTTDRNGLYALPLAGDAPPREPPSGGPGGAKLI